MRTPLFVLLGVSVLTPPAPAADPKATAPPDAPPTEIARLVTQLGDAEFQTREAAAKKLTDLGRPALDPLEAATRSDNPEVAERAGQLLTTIRRKLDNDKALAPAVVEPPAGEPTVRQVFEAIEKQTRYKMRVDGDPAVMTRKVSLDPGKRPFWEVVQQLGDAAGLEIASVQANPLSLAMQERQLRDAAARLDDATKKLRLDVLRKNRAECADKMAALKPEIESLRAAVARGDQEAANKSRPLIVAYSRYEDELSRIDADLAAFDPQDLPLDDLSHGTVSLRAKTGTGSRPWCGQAVRVEAEPPSADALKRQATDTLAVALRVTPEPKLRWNGVTGVSVLKAVAADGRELFMHYPMPAATGMEDAERLMVLRQRQALESRQRGAAAPPVVPVAVAPLVAPPGEKVSRLKSVEGFLRGAVWTDPDEVVVVRGPEAGKTTAATPANGTTLQVRVGATETNLADNSVLVEVTLVYNPNEVRPDADRQTQEEVWLEQQNGRVQPRLQAADPSRVNTPDRPFGLVVSDPDGHPLALTRTSQTVHQTYNQRSQLVTYCTLRGYVRPTEKHTPATVGAVTFRGSRLAEVTVPFKLADVPVAAGTGDGKPLPEEMIYRK